MTFIDTKFLDFSVVNNILNCNKFYLMYEITYNCRVIIIYDMA